MSQGSRVSGEITNYSLRLCGELTSGKCQFLRYVPGLWGPEFQLTGALHLENGVRTSLLLEKKISVHTTEINYLLLLKLNGLFQKLILQKKSSVITFEAVVENKIMINILHFSSEELRQCVY